MTKVRSLRHWKQRFNKNAKFIFRRAVTYRGRWYRVGSPLPKELAASPTKLRRFWESGYIELAEFEAPNVATGQADKKPAKKPNKRRTRKPKKSAQSVSSPDADEASLEDMLS